MEEEKPVVISEIAACHHMKAHVHALADGTLQGPARWYTQLHCSYCNKCGEALEARRNALKAETPAE